MQSIVWTKHLEEYKARDLMVYIYFIYCGVNTFSCYDDGIHQIFESPLGEQKALSRYKILNATAQQHRVCCCCCCWCTWLSNDLQRLQWMPVTFFRLTVQSSKQQHRLYTCRQHSSCEAAGYANDTGGSAK